MMAVQNDLRLTRAVTHGDRARNQEGIEAVHVAARRQDLGRPQQVAARRRTHVVAIKGADNGLEFVVAGEKTVGLGESAIKARFADWTSIRSRAMAASGADAVDEGGDRFTGRPGPPRASAIAASSSTRASRRDRFADRMQSLRNQGLFEFVHLLGDGGDGARRALGGFRCRQFEGVRLFANQSLRWRRARPAPRRHTPASA